MTRVVGRFLNDTSALVLGFSLLDGGKVKWQKVGMKTEDITRIEEASKTLVLQPIRLELLRRNSGYIEELSDMVHTGSLCVQPALL